MVMVGSEKLKDQEVPSFSKLGLAMGFGVADREAGQEQVLIVDTPSPRPSVVVDTETIVSDVVIKRSIVVLSVWVDVKEKSSVTVGPGTEI
jgi:hypothetical protein